jgi:hypothetical protein
MPAADSSGPGPTLTFQEVLVRWGPAYLERWGASLPGRQREVLRTILSCRTPQRGGQLWLCPQGHHFHFAYHSCNDRHCPQCGHTEGQAWLERQAHRLLLPVEYFLITFTVPEAVRAWMRSHPQLGYDQFFAASAQALQDLAGNPRRLGAQLGFMGVLHTSSRTLIYHPHLHYLVPGGGLSLDGRQWVTPKGKFLLAHAPLADRFRNLFRQGLEQAVPEARRQIPRGVWRQHWVVDVKAVGNGQAALRYLGRYIFHTTTGNRRLPLRPDGRLGWIYRDSQTGQKRTVDLEPGELIRRFLQHVLPAGFSRVRYFGWLATAARQKANRVRALLGRRPQLSAAEQAAWQMPAGSFEPLAPAVAPGPPRVWLCPQCHQPLILHATWRAGQPAPRLPVHPARGPPRQ